MKPCPRTGPDGIHPHAHECGPASPRAKVQPCTHRAPAHSPARAPARTAAYIQYQSSLEPCGATYRLCASARRRNAAAAAGCLAQGARVRDSCSTCAGHGCLAWLGALGIWRDASGRRRKHARCKVSTLSPLVVRRGWVEDNNAFGKHRHHGGRARSGGRPSRNLTPPVPGTLPAASWQICVGSPHRHVTQDVSPRSSVSPAATPQRANGRTGQRRHTHAAEPPPPRTSSGRMPVPSARSCASALRTCAKHHAPASTFWPHSAKFAPSSTASKGPCCCSQSCARARGATSALAKKKKEKKKKATLYVKLYAPPAAPQASAARAARSGDRTRRRRWSAAPAACETQRKRACRASVPERAARCGPGPGRAGSAGSAPSAARGARCRSRTRPTRRRQGRCPAYAGALVGTSLAHSAPGSRNPCRLLVHAQNAPAYTGVLHLRIWTHAAARTAAAGRPIRLQTPTYSGGPAPQRSRCPGRAARLQPAARAGGGDARVADAAALDAPARAAAARRQRARRLCRPAPCMAREGPPCANPADNMHMHVSRPSGGERAHRAPLAAGLLGQCRGGRDRRQRNAVQDHATIRLARAAP